MWDAAARSPWATLALAAVLLAGAAAGLPRLHPEVDFVDTVPESASVEAYRHLLDQLDGTRFVAVYMPARDGVNLRDNASFDRLVAEQQSLTAHLERAFPGAFTHSLSVYEAMRAGNYMFQKVLTAGNPPASAYALPQDQFSHDYVRDEVLGDSGKDVLAAGGESALALFFFASKDDGEVRDLSGDVAESLQRWHRDARDRVTGEPQASGLAYASHLTDERTQDDVRFWGAVAAATTALALLLIVRRPADLLAATLSLAAGTVAAFGLVGWLGWPISFLTVFLAPIVTGIGMDYALHVLHAAHARRAAGDAPRRALATALRDVGPAVAASAGATALGLLVLLFVDAPLFAQVGLLGALGVVLGLVASLTLAPALRAILPAPRPRRRGDWIGAGVAAIGMAGRRFWVVPVVLALAVAGVGAWGATKVETASGSAENEFPQDDPAIVLQHRIEAEYGAFQRAYLVVEGDIAQPHALERLLVATTKAEELPLFRSASSVSNLVAADAATDQGALDFALSGLMPQSDADRMPTTPAEARAALDSLFADPLWRGIAPFVVSRDYTLAVVAIQVHPWNGSSELAALSSALDQHAALLQEALGSSYAVHAAGAPLNREAVDAAIPGDVTLASVGVALVVAVTLLVSWARRGRWGIVAALTGVGIVLLAALLLLASVPALDAYYRWAADGGAPANSASLSQMFLLAFAVTVAVGVDGHIQLVHRAWLERDAGASVDEAARRSLKGVGRAVTGTALTTVAAFAPLAGLYFLQSKNLAILTVLGAVYAFVLTMLLTPLVMGRLAAPGQPRSPRKARN